MGDLKTATLLHKKPLKSAGFRVLRAPDVPSVLVELGYVSNRARSAVAAFRNLARPNGGIDGQAIDAFLIATRHDAGARTGAN